MKVRQQRSGRPQLDPSIERLLVRERSRVTLSSADHRRLAALVRATAARLHAGRASGAPPRARSRGWSYWLLRPAVAIALLVVAAAGTAIALMGAAQIWSPEPARTQARPRPMASRPEPPPRSPTLGEEIELLSQARLALARKDYAQAAAQLAEHARRHPDGLLVEEREGLGVMLLWHTGERARASAATRRFAARFPSSPLNRPIRALAELPADAPARVD